MPSSRSAVLQLLTALAMLGCCPNPGPMGPKIKAAADAAPHPEIDRFRHEVEKAQGDKSRMCADFSTGWIREVWCRKASEEWARGERICNDVACPSKCAEAKTQFINDCTVELNKRLVEEVPECAVVSAAKTDKAEETQEAEATDKAEETQEAEATDKAEETQEAEATDKAEKTQEAEATDKAEKTEETERAK